jgi:hypothetical protein
MSHLISVSLLGAAFAAAPAMAVPIQVLGSEYGSQQAQITAPTPPGIVTVNAGAFDVTINGISAVAWCADIQQNISFGSANLNYTAGSLDPTLATRLGQLATKVGYNTFAFDATSSAAFQLAVWEILFDVVPPDYNLTSGLFALNSANTNAAALAQAATWLTGLPGGASHYAIEFYTNRDVQDLIVFRKVPEPGSFAILMVGVGMAGFVVARRRQAS